MILVTADRTPYWAKYIPDPPGGRGVDKWKLTIPVVSLNDHGFYLDCYNIPEEYKQYSWEANQGRIDYKRLLVDGIKSPSDIHVCVQLEKLGYMRFTGNQHNPEWTWDRTRLEAHTVKALEKLYLGEYEWLIGS